MKSLIRKIAAAVLCLFMISLLCGCAENTDADVTSSYPVEITAFSVGKADAVLVRVDDSYMLIDSGESDDAEKIISELKERGITHLDCFQVTHVDKDHVGSAASIVETFDIDNIYYADYEGTRSEYYEFMEAISGNAGAKAISEITRITLGSASLTIYPASDPDEFVSDDDTEYDNELSLVTVMEYGEKVFLFGGDAEKSRLKQMLTQDVSWDCDWIKLPHHGKYCKALKSFLEAASPQYSVMTVSSDEPADDKTLELLSQLGIESYDTLDSDIVTVSDGKTISVYAGE